MQMADKIVLRSVAADPPYLVDDKGDDHPPNEKTGRIPTATGHRRRRGRARVLPVWLAGRPCAAGRSSTAERADHVADRRKDRRWRLGHAPTQKPVEIVARRPAARDFPAP